MPATGYSVVVVQQPEEIPWATKKTSKEAAEATSDVMRDGRTGKKSKTAAGSAPSTFEDLYHQSQTRLEVIKPGESSLH